MVRFGIKLLILVAFGGAVFAAGEDKTTAKPAVEHVEHDAEVIRKNLKELVELPR